MLIKQQLIAHIDAYCSAQRDISALVAGKRVRIKSDYNGQPFGRSRKPLTGQVREVEGALFCSDSLCLFLRGERESIWLSDVEFLDDVPASEGESR